MTHKRLQQHYRVEVILPSGCTIDDIAYGVSRSGMQFMLHYFMPAIFMTAQIYRCHVENWDHEKCSDLQQSLTHWIQDQGPTDEDARKFKMVVDLPEKCDMQLCDRYGEETYIKGYDH